MRVVQGQTGRASRFTYLSMLIAEYKQFYDLFGPRLRTNLVPESSSDKTIISKTPLKLSEDARLHN